MYIRTLATLAALLLTHALGAAQTPNAQLGSAMQSKKVDPAKEQGIRKLLETTHTARTLLDGLRTNLESQKESQPNIPDIFWEEVMKRAETDIGDFITTLVGIYDQHYTKDEIDQMVAFYDTPLGKMMAQKASVVGLATMGAAERWGMKLGMQVMMELVEKGLIKP